ncbi:hypothetical protein CR513_01450, partial [Mucuna pruriens]
MNAIPNPINNQWSTPIASGRVFVISEVEAFKFDDLIQGENVIVDNSLISSRYMLLYFLKVKNGLDLNFIAKDYSKVIVD